MKVRFYDLFHFETPGDPAGGEPAGEPEGEPFSIGQEDWEQVTQALNFLSQQYMATQEPEPAQPAQQTPQFDPFAEDSAEQIRNIIRAEMAPLVQFQYSEQLSEAEEKAYDIIDDIVSREGEFAVKDEAYPMVRAIADSFMQEEIQRHGFGPQAAEAALERAAKSFRAYEQAVGEKHTNQHMNQLKTLTGAASEPGSTYAQGAQQRVVPDYRTGGSVAQRFFGPEK